MGDEWANGRLYEYDSRGRVVSDTVRIDGEGYGTAYAYDALDRVVAMTYPSGEVVTATYNARGLPLALGSSEVVTPLVHSASYDALGQLSLSCLSRAEPRGAKPKGLLDQGAAGAARTSYTYYGDGGTPPGAYRDLPSFRLLRIVTLDRAGNPVQRLSYGYRCSCLSNEKACVIISQVAVPEPV